MTGCWVDMWLMWLNNPSLDPHLLKVGVRAGELVAFLEMAPPLFQNCMNLLPGQVHQSNHQDQRLGCLCFALWPWCYGRKNQLRVVEFESGRSQFGWARADPTCEASLYLGTVHILKALPGCASSSLFFFHTAGTRAHLLKREMAPPQPPLQNYGLRLQKNFNAPWP